MTEESLQLPKELMNEFVNELKQAYKDHDKEVRRSSETRISFLEKLAAVDAGSLAVGASVAIGIFTKSTLPPSVFHGAFQWLVSIVILLWVSLVSAIVHNFLSVEIVSLEVDYSQAEFIMTILLTGLDKVNAHSRLTDDAQMSNLIESLRDPNLAKQRQIVGRIRHLRCWTMGLVYGSVVSFLLAYTILAFAVIVLWRRT